MMSIDVFPISDAEKEEILRKRAVKERNEQIQEKFWELYKLTNGKIQVSSISSRSYIPCSGKIINPTNIYIASDGTLCIRA